MRLRLIYLLAVWIVGSLLKAAPVPVPVKLPPGTVEGYLDNGLHYIILPNSEPVNNVELRLVMRLGSVQESEQQKGAAHFLEHMAFSGTRHFPGRGAVEYLESLGMKYGRDINAVTGFDRTVFMLSVPARKNDIQILDSTLLVLRDWLDGIEFDAARTRKERGVILEELRGYDTGDDFYKLKIGNNIYSQRMPLATPEDIRVIDRSRLKEFYRQWYTPQLATVVVVGHVDPEQTETLIRQRFSDVARRQISGYQTYPLTYPAGIQIQETCDTLSKNMHLELMIPHQTVVTSTLDDVVRKERANLLVRLLSRRFYNRKISCQVSDSWYLADKNHFVLSVSGKDREVLHRELVRALAELDHIVRHGVLADELSDMSRQYAEQLVLPDSTQVSYTWCQDFIDMIISGDRHMADKSDLHFVKQQLLQTTSQELTGILSGWLAAKDTTLLVAFRNNSLNDAPLTTEWIHNLWRDKDSVQVEPFVYMPAVDEAPLLLTPYCLSGELFYDPHDIEDEKTYPNLRVTDITLKNGCRLILRPTRDGSKRVLVNLFARGGLNDLPEDDYYPYEATAGYIEMGGIAKVPGDTLSQFMMQEDISMNVTINNGWHDILASAPWEETKTLLHLIHEKMHDPELCYDDFNDVKQEELESFQEEDFLEKMLKFDSNRRLVNRMNLLVGNIPVASQKKRTQADVLRLDLDSMASYYKRLYTNPRGMIVVVTGDFPADEMKRLLVPAFSRMKENATHLHFSAANRPAIVQKYTEGYPNENTSQMILEYVYPDYYEPSLTGSLTLKLMRDVLQNRILDILREREHLVYSPYVSLYYNGLPEQTFYLNVSLSVDSVNTLRADTLMREIISSLQKQPVPEAELENIKRSFLVNKSQVLTESASVEWRKVLSGLVRNGETLDDFERYETCLEKITPEDIRQAFCKYIDLEKFVLLYIGSHPVYDRHAAINK